MTEPGNSGVVYMIGAAGSRLVKLGFSSRIERRLADLQRMGPAVLTLLWTTPGGRPLESRLHKHLRQYRCHGEWFDFGDADPIVVVTQALDEVTVEAPTPMPTRVDEPTTASDPLPDPSKPPLGDLHRDNPRYHTDEYGCRQLSPTESVAVGQSPDAVVISCGPGFPCGCSRPYYCT